MSSASTSAGLSPTWSAFSDGDIYIEKSATVQDNPAEGVAACIQEAGVTLAEIDQFRHGSTIAINTVLERKGAKNGSRHHGRVP